ncbi:MAG: PAS domain S-box protein [Thermodesulfobacteriota bacterium]
MPRENVLSESERRYRTILEAIDEGYFEVDLAGNLTFCNDALCRITGLPRERLIGMNNREYTSPETARKMYQTFNQVFRTGKPAKIAEYEILRESKESLFFELSTYLITDDQGRPMGFQGIVRDNTHKWKLEQERRLLEKQLQQSLRMEAIGTLAGGIAHDFNNLLTSIQGNVSIMKMRMEPGHSNYEKLKRIEDLIQNGADLTKQLLGFAMGGKYEVKRTCLNEILVKSLKMITRTRKDILIHEDFQNNLWPVEVDRGQIEQVMLNLYINAAHAMPDRGEMTVRTRNLQLEPELAGAWKLPPGRYVEISVIDTGVGMDKEVMERIFEPFFTTKEMGRGTGLGLASTYGIIKNHKGRISVSSAKGRGSAFQIHLPAAEHCQPVGIKSGNPAGKERPMILLVDDEASVREVGEEMLEVIGYDVVSAGTGREAVRLLTAQKDLIDLIILDVALPDLSAAETIKALKNQAPEMKILLSSGYGIGEQGMDLMAGGDYVFIQKPFNINMLSNTLRDMLSGDRCGGAPG